jgi:hypothetical protein
MPWVHDIEIVDEVQRQLVIADRATVTGGRVWPAAHTLCSYLELCATALGLHRDGIRILELGAGCGLLGLTLARNLPGAEVWLTEMEYGGALEHLQYNVARNNLAQHPLSARVASLDWTEWRWPSKTALPKWSGDREKLASSSWDLIIGSDLVYNEAGVKMLPQVIRCLCSEDTIVLYCHTKNRFPPCPPSIQLTQGVQRSHLLRFSGISAMRDCARLISPCGLSRRRGPCSYARARARAPITRTVSMKLQVPGLADHGSNAQGLIWGPALHFVIQHAHADVCVCLVT